MSVIAQAGAKGRQLHKFGGSSLADVKCYLRVAGIMAEYSQPDDMMVVSAAGSTTNQLINWLKLSQTDRLSAHQVQQTLRRYQCDLIYFTYLGAVEFRFGADDEYLAQIIAQLFQ